jgi:excinuclease UvrABC nuclease subunit
MPVQNKTSYLFSEIGVAGAAPAESGVYIIYNSQNWIYVGEAKNIADRLFEHVRKQSDQSARIYACGPVSFTYELCDAYSRVARETQLIRELRPLANL